MNFRIDIEYDGSLYHGWQVQPNGMTVQEAVETALFTILRRRVNVIGAGRTDAGVHALGQVAHFHTDTLPVPLKELQRSLNGLLKEGITIHRLRKVPEAFHARYSALERTYVYSIALRKRSIDRNRFFFYPQSLDAALMKRAARRLEGRHDFRNLSIATGEKSTVCTIKRAVLLKKGPVITFRITADRFLHKMVRMIAGCLINVGRGKVKPAEMPDPGKKKAFCAPAHGLCLIKVRY